MRKVDEVHKKTRGDIARELRIQEAEKQRQYREQMKTEKQRLLAQFNEDHQFKRPEK